MLRKRLKEMRKLRGLSQEYLGKKINVSKAAISNYESGYSSPSNESLKTFADVLNTTTDYLLGRTDKMNEFDDADHGPSTKRVAETAGNYETSGRSDSMKAIDELLNKYGIEDSGFFDIKNWEAMDPEEIRTLESYFEFISKKAMARQKSNKDENN